MEKSKKLIVWMIVLYCFMFFAGFKSGQMNARLRSKIKIDEKVSISEDNKLFYIVEKQKHGDYNSYLISTAKVSENNPFMRFYFNEKMRHYLELMNVSIYDQDGNMIYGNSENK